MLALLVRHAVAGDRREVARRRPAAAARSAAGAAGVGAPRGSLGPSRSPDPDEPVVRCIETVEPLAAALGVEVEETPALAEGAARSDVIAASPRHRRRDGDCTHGDVCHALVGQKRMPKGSIWVIDIDGHDVTAVRHIAAPA